MEAHPRGAAGARRRGGDQQRARARAGSALARRHGVATRGRRSPALTPDRAAFDAALAAEIDRHRPGPRRARGFHAHPDRRVRRALRGPARQHPSVAAAGVSRPGHAPPGARGRRAHPRLHRAFRDARARQRADHRAGGGPGGCRTIPRRRSRRACSRRSTGIYPQVVRWICEGRVGLAPDGRVTVRQAGTPAGSLASPPLDRHERRERRRCLSTCEPDRQGALN